MFQEKTSYVAQSVDAAAYIPGKFLKKKRQGCFASNSIYAITGEVALEISTSSLVFKVDWNLDG